MCDFSYHATDSQSESHIPNHGQYGSHTHNNIMKFSLRVYFTATGNDEHTYCIFMTLYTFKQLACCDVSTVHLLHSSGLRPTAT